MQGQKKKKKNWSSIHAEKRGYMLITEGKARIEGKYQKKGKLLMSE